jgi:Bacterial Ig-like domain (group 3)
VPRGTYEPNGFKASNSVPLFTSPLSAGNWAQRIQVHLGYAPLAANCPPTIVPDAMVGTQVAYRAVSSWQTALNQTANCSKVYSFTATTENEATGDLPPGYLPLPASLQTQAQSVATQLRALASTAPMPVLKVTESPSTPEANQATTLTATVTGYNGTPTGTVQFTVGGTAIGAPVSLGPQGTATTTVVFATAGPQQLTAVYTPDTGNYASTSITWTENVLPAGSLVSGEVPLAVAVPVAGSFSLTVQTQNVVTLTASPDGSTATAVTPPIVVEATMNTYPGWSVTGQASGFTGSGTAAGGSIPGDQLGWAPAASLLAAGATLGAVVPPRSPGLVSTAAVLALAPPGNGFGATSLDPALTLAIPPTAPPGPYNGSLTISAIVGSP